MSGRDAAAGMEKRVIGDGRWKGGCRPVAVLATLAHWPSRGCHPGRFWLRYTLAEPWSEPHTAFAHGVDGRTPVAPPDLQQGGGSRDIRYSAAVARSAFSLRRPTAPLIDPSLARGSPSRPLDKRSLHVRRVSVGSSGRGTRLMSTTAADGDHLRRCEQKVVEGVHAQPVRLAALARERTPAKIDSIALPVRRSIQCSSGNS